MNADQPGPRNEAEERAATEHPEEFWRRREFLARTAAVAGVAGLASVLPADTLVALAAREQSRRPFPSARNMPLDTIVVLMMENRSFDHYLGSLRGADGVNAGLSFPGADGRRHRTHYLPPDYQGCGFQDPDHSWDGGRLQYRNGRLDGFYEASDSYALGFYRNRDLGFLAPAIRKYMTFDRYFCSILASTFPNRHYMLAAQSGGQKRNVLPSLPAGNPWETIFDRAGARGVEAAYYVVDLPVPALYGTRGIGWMRPIERFYEDAAAGKLPPIVFVDPPFIDGGGGDGLSGDEHPHGDIRIGQSFMAEVAHAFMESRQYRRGAMFINYDEWGGFFDHVAPVRVPDERASVDIAEDFGITGFRIPNVVISPYARRGGVSHMTVTHESILKLISYRFRLGHLTMRHRYASQIGRALDFEKPDREVPDLPRPAPPATLSCSARGQVPSAAQQRAEKRAKEELEGPGLEALGTLADRLGYEVRPATAGRVFREPDRARRALGKGWRAAAD
ncbi:MAG TPA: alkaline phosphatase family protein [Solirubrobacterales bacterium]|nr:alkaline phosphatase family protein [Solirubrobacterales bacterium]